MLSPDFTAALAFASELHNGHFRKGSSVPYVSHLMAVAAIVLENGGGEEEAIAALLHDAVEDRGGRPTLERIRRRFGDRVAAIVDACSDTDQTPKPPWKERKQRYLEHVRSADASVRLVSAADKLHNGRSLVSDYRQVGEELWRRFNAGKEETLWYYRSLVQAFREAGGGPLVDELDRVVTELERLTSAGAR